VGVTDHEQRLVAILAADAAGYSRLMAADDHATVAALDAARSVFRSHVESNHGRVVDVAGDSVLAVFKTAAGAIAAALAVQQELETASGSVPEERRMRFRIGVHLGDVIEKADGSVYGDGVNIAARLQSLAVPGGVTVSDSVRVAVRGKVQASFEDQGEQSVKNIAEPVRAFRLVTATGAPSARGHVSAELQQEIRFCTASDGVQLAYAVMGSGPPLVKAGNWMTHLEYELESPDRRRFWGTLAREHTVIRYDARGNGLSDRDVEDISFDAFVRDLEAVVEAAKVERFALVGYSQGCAVSIAYAVRHPERVSHLVLYGGFAQGPNRRPLSDAHKQANAAMLTLMRVGWGQDNAAFRQVFTSQFMPDATKEQEDWFNELQRRAITPENAVRYMEAVADFDVVQLLPQVTVPTLVLHARDDARVPFDSGRRIAAAIPGARLVPLQSRNHILEGDRPAAGRFLEEVQMFLRQGNPSR
jgi:class 3 adenylate cyclase/pimeloyl-ACP methyl ester carboxylesterase